MVALFVMISLVALLTIDHLIQRRLFSRELAVIPLTRVRPDQLPEELFVGSGHAWARLEGRRMRLGADGLPATILGRVDHVELVPAGTRLRRGDALATLTSGTKKLVVRAPFDGLVKETNEHLTHEPHAVALDPFGHGWLASLEPQDLAGAMSSLRLGRDAQGWLRAEASRLRDAIAALTPSPVGATMLDGGVPMPGAATGLADAAFNQLADDFLTPRDAPEAAPTARLS